MSENLQTPPPSRWESGGFRRFIGLLAVVLILIMAFATILVLGLKMKNFNEIPSVAALTMGLVVGSAALLVMLMTFALVSSYIGGKNATIKALGMPEGSVSAVLALMLLIIFALVSFHLFNEIKAGETAGTTSTGISPEVLQTLPQDRIISLTLDKPGAANGKGRTYTVLLTGVHESSTEFARTSQQLVGTLLTAVVGFYFGQRAVEAGIARPKKTGTEKTPRKPDEVPEP